MGKTKELTGIVVSDRMQKTAVVKVMRLGKHPKYGKVLKHHVKFKVHDEKREAKLGDMVVIRETRPLSKDKCFRLLKILQRAAPDVQIKSEDLIKAPRPEKKPAPKMKEKAEAPAAKKEK
jgi:small subunit ribosomal protein S17